MPEVAGDGMKGCTLLVVVHRKPFPFFRKFPLTDHYRSSGSLGLFLDRNPTRLSEYLFETIYQPIMVAITVFRKLLYSIFINCCRSEWAGGERERDIKQSER